MSSSDPEGSGTPNPVQRTDIAEIANREDWTGSLVLEDRKGKEYSQSEEAADNRHKRWRSSILFGVALLSLIAVFLLSIVIIMDKNAAPEDKKLATAVITSIVSGLIGFVTGKALI